MSRRSQVKQKIDEGYLPEDVAADLVTLAEQADRYHAIKALTDTEGGRAIREVLQKDALHSINRLASNYTTLSHTEFISICAGLHATLTHLRLLSNARNYYELLDKEIKDALGD